MWIPLGVLAVVTFGAVLTGALGGSPPGAPPAAPADGAAATGTAQEIEDYEAAVVPLVLEGGKLVELGVKVGLSDLSEEHVTASAVIAEQAGVWNDELTALGDRLADIAPPPGLEAAHDAFVDALQIYADAAALVEEAALSAPGDARGDLLDQVVDVGTRADRRYDEGASLLQDRRRHSGLGPSSDFPDPEER